MYHFYTFFDEDNENRMGLLCILPRFRNLQSTSMTGAAWHTRLGRFHETRASRVFTVSYRLLRYGENRVYRLVTWYGGSFSAFWEAQIDCPSPASSQLPPHKVAGWDCLPASSQWVYHNHRQPTLSHSQWEHLYRLRCQRRNVLVI